MKTVAHRVAYFIMALVIGQAACSCAPGVPQRGATLLATVKHNVCSICLSKDDSELFVGLGNGRVMKCNVDTGATSTLQTEDNPIQTVSVSRDGRYLAFIHYKYLSVMDLRTGKILRTVAVASIGVDAAQFLGQGHSFAVSSTSVTDSGSPYSVSVWNADTGTMVWSVPLPASAPALAVSRDGRFIGLGCTTGELVVVNTVTRTVASKRLDAVAVMAVAFSPDSSHVVAGSSGGVCSVLPISLRSVKSTWNAGGFVVSISYSEDGLVVACGKVYTNEIQLWSPRTSECQATVGIGTDGVGALAFSRNGRWLFAADFSGIIAKYDLHLVLPAKND